MPIVAKVGEAFLARGEITFEWNVSDFFSLSEDVDNYYVSPTFSFSDARWHLKLFPNGQTKHSSSGWVGLALVREDPGPPQTVNYTFGIKSCGGEKKESEMKREFTKGKSWGFPKCWSRSNLMNEKSTLLPNNVLTITCDLRSDAVCSVRGEKKCLKSLLSMLKSGDDSDVVLKVQGKEFPAHRGILRARSPVFRSMFTHDMAEKQSNVVTIEDCDPEAFSDFLVHIYSGCCEQISSKNVYGLYTAADKYDFGELKEACAEFMKRNITVASFCDVIAIALKHDDKELVECATTYFCQNTEDIAKTADWQTFLKDNSTVGNELFIKSVSTFRLKKCLTCLLNESPSDEEST